MRNIAFSRTVLLSAAASVALLSATGRAWAQTVEAPIATASDTEQEDATVVGEIIVTGTSIRGISAVGSKTTVLDRESIQESGLNNPVELLRTLPQVQGLGYDETPHVAQNGQANVQRGTSVSLRGLSSNATLLLIDGRRIAQTGNVTSFTEANQLPLSFIERVDVVADGASAIYGSDAIAGVVNYITRKNFEGLEVTARYGNGHGWDQWGGSALFGRTWQELGPFARVSAVVAYDHDERSAMLQGARPFLKQDLRQYGGPDNRIRGNALTSAPGGNIIVPGTGQNPTLPTAGTFRYYTPVAGFTGTGPTALIANNPQLLDEGDYRDYIPDTTRDQISLNLNFELNNGLQLYYQGYYNDRESITQGIQQASNFSLPASSPFYIPGVPGVAVGAPQLISVSFLRDVGRTPIGLGGHVFATSSGHTVGARKDLFADWEGEAIFSTSFARTCANCMNALEGNFDSVAFQAALNSGSFNPFGTTPASEAVLSRFLVAGSDQNASLLNQTSLRFNGSLFSLPAGLVRAAFGYERVHTHQRRTSIGIKFTSDTVGADGTRDIDSIYGEVFVPLLAEGMVPFVQSLDLDLAVRTEDYSDVGRTTNPKIGLVLRVNDELSFRSAYGTSFRAPNITEANLSFFSSKAVSLVANGSGDPGLPLSNAATGQSYVVTFSGSNPDLVPEEASNLTFGVDFEPSWLPGLSLSATYYKVQYDNQIIGLQTALASYIASPTNRAIYAPFITPVTQPTSCVAGNRSTYNPAVAAVFGRPSLNTPDETNACRVVAIFDGRNTNAASTLQDGLDLDARYVFDTDMGQFSFTGNAAYIFANDVQTSPNAAVFDGLDRMNYPISLRGRIGAGWARGGLNANLAMNYVGGYTNDLPITIAGVRQPVKDVPAWQTLDLALAYRFEAEGSWLSGVRASVNVQNLLDRDPPTVLSTNGYAVDIQSHNVLGRVVSFQLSRTF